MKLSAGTLVNRSPEEVFALWADLERSTEYSAATLERRKLTAGPIGLGTRFHAVDRWPGRTVTFTVEVSEYEPPTRMAASWSGTITGGWDVSFRAVDGGTEVEFTTRMEPSGLMGLLAPLMRPWAASQLRGFMADFRRWAEAQPRRAAGSVNERSVSRVRAS